jgi:hypothetical protein
VKIRANGISGAAMPPYNLNIPTVKVPTMALELLRDAQVRVPSHSICCHRQTALLLAVMAWYLRLKSVVGEILARGGSVVGLSCRALDGVPTCTAWDVLSGCEGW